MKLTILVQSEVHIICEQFLILEWGKGGPLQRMTTKVCLVQYNTPAILWNKMLEHTHKKRFYTSSLIANSRKKERFLLQITDLDWNIGKPNNDDKRQQVIARYLQQLLSITSLPQLLALH